MDESTPSLIPGYLTSWLALLTQYIEDCFEANETAGAVLVDLTAAYDAVWHLGLPETPVDAAR